MSAKEVVIVSAVRTPIGSFCGALSTLKAHELGTVVIKECLARAKVKPTEVSEVIMGQSLTSGQGQNPARQASLAADIPLDAPAYLINMLCGSGLKTVVLGCQAIKNGDAEIVVSGGQESMSQAPHVVYMRSGNKLGAVSLLDTMLKDGLTDAFCNIHMGETAENVATSHKITREEQDVFAFESQQLVEKAQKANIFAKEIVPVTVQDKKGATVVAADEYPRHGTTLEALRKLNPTFVKDGTVTAGNSSGMNDGAAAVVLMSLDLARQRGIKPMARVVAYAQGGVEPAEMGMGPVPAVKNVLVKAGWKLEEVDVFELNEAFSAQSIAVIRDLGVDPKKVNIAGGSIALGHPIGASGTRVLVTLLHAMQRTGGKRGVASLCIGGGMGIAMCVESC